MDPRPRRSPRCASLARRPSDFHIVLHEDLSLDPVGCFGEIYHSLGLPYTERASETVAWGSLSPSGTKNAERPHVWTLRGGLSKTSFRPLDSREHLHRWRNYLSGGEAAEVRSLTKDVASRFYRGDEKWRS